MDGFHHSFSKFRGFSAGKVVCKMLGSDREQDRRGCGMDGADVLAGEMSTKHKTV